jgi:hypothetical protein
MTSKQQLTGRRRFRVVDLNAYSRIAVDRRDVIVLQVEYSMWMEAYKHHTCFWRDAKPEDITSAEAVVDIPNP